MKFQTSSVNKFTRNLCKFQPFQKCGLSECGLRAVRAGEKAVRAAGSRARAQPAATPNSKQTADRREKTDILRIILTQFIPGKTPKLN